MVVSLGSVNILRAQGDRSDKVPVSKEPQVVPYDLVSISEDVATPPALSNEALAPGVRFKQQLPGYENTDIYHVVYLPADWRPGKTFPVIVEYAGNTPRNHLDKTIGRPEGCMLGFGLTKGIGTIWVCMPYIAQDARSYQLQWWGDVERTVEYCKSVVPEVCREFGGDPRRVVLAGFSRGSIACNYLGLHDDEIAQLWCGFLCHSHYDGIRTWGYANDDRESAARRLQRLGDRSQWISHEQASSTSVAEVRDFVLGVVPNGNFQFVSLPFTNHSPRWVYRDIPEREAVLAWYNQVIGASGSQASDN